MLETHGTSGQLPRLELHQRESWYVHPNISPYPLLELFTYMQMIHHLCVDLLVLFSVPPRPLLQLCRLKIRKLLGMTRLKKIHKLPVPPMLIKFLNHQEREQDWTDI